MSNYKTLTALKPILTAIEAVGDFDFAELKGKNVISYYYSKDKKPGCRGEGEDVGEEHENFEQGNTDS